jgi:hypothetical protein
MGHDQENAFDASDTGDHDTWSNGESVLRSAKFSLRLHSQKSESSGSQDEEQG